MLNKKQYICKQRLKKEFLWLSFVSYVRYWKMITKVSFGQEANKAQLYFCDLTKYTVISWVILIAWATASMDYEQSAALVSGVLRLVTSPLDTRVRMHSPR